MSSTEKNNPALRILLAAPRGFCAGVTRAIEIVEESLKTFGPPVYVRHEIVHNKDVVTRLENKGAVFIDQVDQCPPDRPIIFSAHGVPKSIPDEAAQRHLQYIDATCPLVSKVHREAERHAKNGTYIFLVGHKNHPEVEGTMGQVAEDQITLVETIEEARIVQAPKQDQPVAYVTQTTLSVDDTKEIVDVLRHRFPDIQEPLKADICYATSNRQDAVKAISKRCDLLLVIGSKSSSNSRRLVETGQRAGATRSQLIDSATDIDPDWLNGVTTLGLTAGASAPEHLVEQVLQWCKTKFDVDIETVEVVKENVVFKAPPIVRARNE